jgi:hypothetical protein
MNRDADSDKKRLHRIRLLTILFIAGLVIAGATAIPVQNEAHLLLRFLPADWIITKFLSTVTSGLDEAAIRFPFLFYGTDWLAFGHFVIAIVFYGALKDPIRNRWLFQFGMIASVLVIPYAMIFGAWRHIPFIWRCLDSSFGLLGFVPMWVCDRWAGELERMEAPPR